jgi:serine/threonine protein kinase
MIKKPIKPIKHSKMLSSGGYGCVYYPSISCKGQQGISDKKVTKVQISDESAINEIEIGKIIKKIPMYINHFVPVDTSCPIKITELNKNLIETCDILNKKSNKKYILMDMDYIKGDNFDDYLLNTEDEKQLINSLISSYTYLLYSLNLLFDHNIIHYDLKGNNIMYNYKKNIPLIIDFGMSIDLEKLTFENIYFYFFTYSPSYYIWCPEIHIINYLLHVKSNISKGKLREICYEITKYNKALVKILSAEFLDNYVNSMVNFYSLLIDKDYKYIINKLLSYSNTWDNYSLSNIYLKIISKIFNNDFENNDFIIHFSQMLLQNLHPNPEKRLTIDETIIKFEDILTTSKKHDFENVLLSLNKNKKVFNKNIEKESKHISIITETIMKTKQN